LSFKRCTLAALILAVLLARPVLALENPLLSSEEIRLSADQLFFDQENQQYRASGSVEVLRGELRLTADEARLDEGSGEIFSSGDVRLTSPSGTMSARAIRYNFNDGTGTLTDGRLALSRNRMFLSGAEVERLGDTHYRVHDGSFTTCSGDDPAWKFSATDLEIELGAFAQAKHAFFRLYDIPVLYIPYIAFPAKTERSSGFLLPEVGFSQRLGTEVTLPWYQVIDVNQDATFTVHTMSDLGVGTGGEYRYLFGRSRTGTLAANLVTGSHDEPERYWLSWEHDGYLPGDIRLVADGEYVNKSDYYNLFGRDAGTYTTDHVVSDLFLSRNWDAVNLTALTRYTKTLYADNKPVLQTLPELRLSVMPTRVGDSPLLYALTAESTYFWRRQGEKGERLRALPSLSTDLLSSRYLELLPTAAWHEQVYWVGGEPIFAGRPEFAITAGNSLGRIYGNGENASALRHVFDTRIDYVYAPGLDPAPIPQFDAYDDFSPVNRLHGQIDNRFTLRRADVAGIPHYLDVFTLGAGIDYDIHEERRQLTLPGERRQRLSPLRIEAVVRPVETFYLRGRGEFALEQARGRMDALAVWGGYTDSDGTGVLVNYSYLRDGFEYLSGGVDVALLKPFYLGHETRYDLVGDHNLEHRTFVEYRGSCWSLAGNWLERTDEKQFSLTFSLSGLTGKTMRPRSADLNDWL